jgi:hypothetical protein
MGNQPVPDRLSGHPPCDILVRVTTVGAGNTGNGVHDHDLVEHILAEARAMVGQEIAAAVAHNRRTGYGPLYDLVEDYPFREGKGLRPAICLAAARAAGGHRDQVQA